MNAGRQTIDWLFDEQLQIDEKWAVRTPTGFTWWADQNAQSIEIVGEQTTPDGQTGYAIAVRTQMLADLDLDLDGDIDGDGERDKLLELNEAPMRTASLSGPVYDRQARTLSLCSVARVHEETAGWMGVLLGSAAVTQLAEARILGPDLAGALGAQPAVSAHPDHGYRPEPDEMVYAVGVFVEEGRSACQWPEGEFADAVANFMAQPPSLGASASGQSFVVEFPFGERSSLCRVIGTQTHPLYGHGLFALQRFPFGVGSPAQGAALALELNAAELTQDATGFGFGSYVYDNGMICFTEFVPNSLHRQVALPNLYFACAARAHAMSVWLLDKPWDAESFTPEHSAMGRRQSQSQGTSR